MAPPWELPLVPPSHPATPQQSGGFPARTSSKTGSQFMQEIMNLKGQAREDKILEEFRRGNIPEFLKKTQEVTTTFVDKNGVEHTAVFKVMPDYLAIGTDKDHVLIPIAGTTAETIANEMGYSLPTAKLVDETFKQSTIKLANDPGSKDPTERLTRDYWRDNPGAQNSTAAYQEHDKAIQARYDWEYRKKYGLTDPSFQAPRGEMTGGPLTAGHKKDVVLGDRADWGKFGPGESGQGELAFYGFFNKDGTPIQAEGGKGVSVTAHDPSYVDYSHGARLVEQTVTVDGKPMNMNDLLKHPDLHPLASGEGPMNDPHAWGKPKT